MSALEILALDEATPQIRAPGAGDTYVANRAINLASVALTVTSAALNISGNQSATAWTTSGIQIKGVTATLTDTTSSGTVAAAYTNVLYGNTIAASSATTFTNYYNTFFGDPVAGSNVTFTSKYSLGTAGRALFGNDISIVGNGTTWRLDANSTAGTLTFAHGNGANPKVSLDWSDNLRLAVSLKLGWSSVAGPTNTIDTALTRSAAGVVEVNNGTSGTFRDLKLQNLLAGGGNGSYIQTPSMTVANLASAATAGAGARAFVTDATATTFLSTVAGGGANKVPVVSNGANWLIG